MTMGTGSDPESDQLCGVHFYSPQTCRHFSGA